MREFPTTGTREPSETYVGDLFVSHRPYADRKHKQEYTIPYFNTDLTAAALQYPMFLQVGGNTGTTNSFTPVDIANLTGGVYNAQSLAQGNNAMCFAYQNAQLVCLTSEDFLYLC